VTLPPRTVTAATRAAFTVSRVSASLIPSPSHETTVTGTPPESAGWQSGNGASDRRPTKLVVWAASVSLEPCPAPSQRLQS
jgi:hypothetical protein